MEERSIMRRRQPFQELRHLRREPIIDLIARGPQRVAACLGESVDLQHRIVGGYALETDVSVPSY